MTLSGVNGSGKTTLLRILAGEVSADAGRVDLGKAVRVALHDQRPPRESGQTLRDYVLAGLEWVLGIERELARVREEIERMEGRLRYLKAHVATSSLTVTVHEPAPVVGETGSGGVIGEAFRDAWRNFVNFVAGLIASLGVVIPGAALVLAGLLGVRWIWRRGRS